MGNGYPHSTIAQILEDIIDQLSFEGESHSNIADILLSILNQTSYDKEPYSVLAELFLKLKAKIEGEPFDPYDKETHSVIAEILLSILNETEYTDMPQSRIAELLLELKEELESYTEITVSGSIVSFTTNVSKPLVKLKANVVAMQDLHGYDKPWAGGGGKNKLSYVAGTTTSANNITMIINDDGSVKATSSGTSTGSHFFLYNTIYLPVGTYYLYATVNGTAWAYDPNGKFRIYVAYDRLGYNFGSTLNVTDASKAITVYVQGFGNKTFNDTVNLMICEGSTVPTAWTPYENICPITGWSGANVTRTGKNVWNEQAESGSIIPATGVDVANANKIRSVGFISVKPNTTYNIVFADTTAGSDYLYYYKKDGTFINSESYVHTVSGNKTFTTPTDCYNLRFIMSLTEYNNKISVNYPSTDTAYHAYNGNTYTIAFGDTYYGGELDVTNGVLRVVKAIVDLGSLNWNTPTNRSTYYGLANIIKVPINAGVLCGAIAEKYHEVPSNSSLTTDGQFAVGTNGYLYFYRVTDTPTGMFVYPLATPFTIQLTPQQIEQLEENNIWADTGDVKVTYIYKGTPET